MNPIRALLALLTIGASLAGAIYLHDFANDTKFVAYAKNGGSLYGGNLAYRSETIHRSWADPAAVALAFGGLAVGAAIALSGRPR